MTRAKHYRPVGASRRLCGAKGLFTLFDTPDTAAVTCAKCKRMMLRQGVMQPDAPAGRAWYVSPVRVIPGTG